MTVYSRIPCSGYPGAGEFFSKKGDDIMCQALMDLMKDEIEEREKEAAKYTRSDDIKSLMSLYIKIKFN